VIFTIPALIILGYWQDFRYSWVLAIAGLGGILGVLFSVPLRRSMIVGRAAALPGRQGRGGSAEGRREPGPGMKILAISAVIGGGVKLLAESGMRLIPDKAPWPASGASSSATWARACRRRCSAVGYIVGLNIGIVVLSGSVLSYNIAIPIYHAFASSFDPELAARLVGMSAADAAGPDPRREGALPRRRARCWWAACGRCSRCAIRCCPASAAASPRAQGRPPPTAGDRARPADEVDADRAGAVRDPAAAAATRRSCSSGR
jgi:hypothetical protein